MPISSSQRNVGSKDLLLCAESSVEVTLYPDKQLPKCPAIVDAEPRKRSLLGLCLAAGDRLFEATTLLREVDAETTGVCGVLATLHEPASLEPPQHLSDVVQPAK